MITAGKNERVYIFALVTKTFLKINRITTPMLVKKYFAMINGSRPYWRKKAITGLSSDEPLAIKIRVSSASKILSIRMAVMAANNLGL